MTRLLKDGGTENRSGTQKTSLPLYSAVPSIECQEYGYFIPIYSEFRGFYETVMSL